MNHRCKNSLDFTIIEEDKELLELDWDVPCQDMNYDPAVGKSYV